MDDDAPRHSLGPETTAEAALRDIDAKLSPGQKAVLNEVITGGSVFFSGSAGTGKSFLLAKILKSLNKLKKKVILTAATGIAAVNIGGRTFHSACGIGLGKGDVKHLLRYMGREAKERWNKMDVLVVDEISMIDGALWDKVEEIARIMRGVQKPFGGIQLVITGDFLQLPPVKFQKYCFEAKTWKECLPTQFQLTKVFRQEDRSFVSMLQEIREGYCSENTLRKLNDCMVSEPKDEMKITKLYTTNRDVNNENLGKLNKIKSKPVTYKSLDSFDSKYPNLKVLLDKNCIAQEYIKLKVGARVMLLWNVEPGSGLVNGSIGTVINLNKDGGDPEIQFKHTTRTIEPATWTVFDGKNNKASRRQYPLKLAWAVTVHKCQGTTLDSAEMSLADCFAAGQAYVALSRVKSLDGIQLLTFDPNKVHANMTVLTYYREHFPGSIAVRDLSKIRNQMRSPLYIPFYSPYRNMRINTNDICENQSEHEICNISPSKSQASSCDDNNDNTQYSQPYNNSQTYNNSQSLYSQQSNSQMSQSSSFTSAILMLPRPPDLPMLEPVIEFKPMILTDAQKERIRRNKEIALNKLRANKRKLPV